APRRDLVPRRGPEPRTVLQAVGRDERVPAQVALEDDAALVDHRGTGESPLVLPLDGEAGVEGAEVALPEELAVEVVAVEPLGPEAGNHARAVGGRGAVGVAPLQVPLDLRHALEGGLRPEDFAREAVEAEDLEGVLLVVVHRRRVAVVAGPDAGVPADRGSEEHAVAPDDWARVAEAGDRRRP